MTTTMKRNLAKGFGPVLLLAAALALPGSAGAQSRSGYGPYGPQNRSYAPGGTIDGYVSTERGPCLVLRDRQNRSYYLQGDTRGLRPGDQVRLRERMVSRSSCGNDGPTLEVLEIRTVWTNGSHRSAYFDSRRDGSFDRFVLRNRDRGGWYADRYSYMRQGDGRYDRNGRYGDRDRGYGGRRYDPNGPNGPNGQYAPPYDPNGQGQPQYAPNDQYDQNNQNEPSDRNGQYDNQEDYGPNGPPNDDRNSGNQPVSVDGTLDFNHACPQIRAGNVTYDLAGNLGNYHDGDRVHVDGVLAGSSSCGGTALEVRGIRRR